MVEPGRIAFAHTAYPVHVELGRDQARAGLERARRQDVTRGGVYDARSAAINIWSQAWDTPEGLRASELVGAIMLRWESPRAERATIYLLQVEAGRTRGDVERHVAALFGEHGP